MGPILDLRATQHQPIEAGLSMADNFEAVHRLRQIDDNGFVEARDRRRLRVSVSGFPVKG